MMSVESVLVIDDDEDLIALEADILESAGYEVRTAKDGCEGLDRVAEQMPRLILLDIRMPRMDGTAFAREFRNRYGAACCPIIVVTADENALLRARQVGAEACFAKPFDMEELLQTAAHLMS